MYHAYFVLQEYYTDVANPIDLSKVMLKFHGGAYSSLDSFTRDMRQMFNNYKNFFKEANAEVGFGSYISCNFIYI